MRKGACRLCTNHLEHRYHVHRVRYGLENCEKDTVLILRKFSMHEAGYGQPRQGSVAEAPDQVSITTTQP